jgi:hypothetical protein
MINAKTHFGLASRSLYDTPGEYEIPIFEKE